MKDRQSQSHGEWDCNRSRANERLHFVLGDIKQEKDVRFDLMLYSTRLGLAQIVVGCASA
jgi:hypothetical protein